MAKNKETRLQPHSSSYDVAVMGGLSMDYVGQASHLPEPGGSVRGKEFRRLPGGKGGNAAVAVNRLGCRAALLGCVGVDAEGADILRHLHQEQVGVRFIKQVEAAPTGATLVQVGKRGQKQTLWRPGCNDHLTAEDVQQAADLFAASPVLLVQLEVPLQCVEAALQQAGKREMTVVLDPAPARPLPDAVYRQLDVITPNAQEAETLTGVKVEDRGTAREAAEHLLERGVGSVAVQAGDEGSLLIDPHQEHWLPRLSVKAVDTTGAGDAFAAGLAVRLSEGSSLKEAARFANACAGLATTGLGAQSALPDRASAYRALEPEYQ